MTALEAAQALAAPRPEPFRQVRFKPEDDARLNAWQNDYNEALKWVQANS